MGKDVHRYRFHIFKLVCRLVGFLLREGGGFCYSLFLVAPLDTHCIHLVSSFWCLFINCIIYLSTEKKGSSCVPCTW